MAPPTPALAPFLCSLVLLVPLFLRGTLSCSTPPGGCTAQKCFALRGLKPPSSTAADTRIGWIYGAYNKNLNGGVSTGHTSTKASGWVNYEVFPAVETNYVIDVDTSWATSLEYCCYLCAATDGCWVYQYFPASDTTGYRNIFGDLIKYRPYNWYGPASPRCILLTGGEDKDESARGAPYSGTHTNQTNSYGYPNKYTMPSWVGGLCNGNSSVKDDPHFTGAHGTRFEFNGDVDKTFALLTDERLHMNVKLGGYYDTRTIGATLLREGLAVRTWIREIGILWKDEAGQSHSAAFTARRGSEKERAEGFLAGLAVDGMKVEPPRAVGDNTAEGLFSLTLLRVGKRGPYDEETYELEIQGILNAVLKMRVAHPLLQTAEDAQVHFNIHIKELQPTEKIHGVLGQTFRGTVHQTVKALEYSMLGKLLGRPVVADGESGRGFLDGEPKQYQTSGILATDSMFSSFMQ